MDRLKSAVDKILGRLPNARGRGEEATKQSLVLPLLDALGYDIWNPAEVCPEYEADFAIKKYGQKEKVDLALFLQDVPRIYVEVKSVDEPLDGHEGQLSRYFNATPTVSLAVLTNGIEYRFYTDTAEANVMDPRPFHNTRFDALDQGLEVLARFQKSVFSPEAIREYARELNYTARIVDFLRDKLDLRDRDPSEDLVCWARVVGIFPHRGARARLTGMLLEKHEYMLTDKKANLIFHDAPAEQATPSSFRREPNHDEGGIWRCVGAALALPGLIAFAPEWLRSGAAPAAPAIPAPEPALGSLPSVTISSAQVIAILNPTPGVGSEITLWN